jgi:hypothetical protein
MPTNTHDRSLVATAWYDPFQIMVAAAVAWRPWGAYTQSRVDRPGAAPTFDQIAENCRTVAEAQSAVVGELLRMPFWLTGQASPADLYQTRDGDKVYHLPGQASYERVQPEAVFATEDEAQAAGYRRSQAAGGGAIKGHISREGERIYHRPGQANYDRLEADQLFETEAQAEANGFRPAQR